MDAKPSIGARRTISLHNMCLLFDLFVRINYLLFSEPATESPPQGISIAVRMTRPTFLQVMIAMEELVAPARHAGVIGPVACDFIPTAVIAQFQSPDYQQRVAGSAEIANLIESVSLDSLDIPGLLHFVEPYVCDLNYPTTQNVCRIVSRAILRSPDPAQLLHDAIRIVLCQFGDRRRPVCHHGQSILRDLLSSCDQFDVLSELVRAASAAPSTRNVEVLRCLGALLADDGLDPDSLIQFPFYFDAAITDQHQTVRQAAIWCISTLREHFPAAHSMLLGLLSRDASAALGKSVDNPGTAVALSRSETVVKTRAVNTAPPSDKQSTDFSGGRSQYRRPMIPGAKTILFGSVGRPISTIPDDALEMLSATFFVGSPADDRFPIKPGPPDDRFAYKSEPTVDCFSDDPINEPMDDRLPQKWDAPKPSRRAVIALDGMEGPRPRVMSKAKSEARHITFAPMADDVADEPIRASGFYNLGDDIDFDEVAPVPERRKLTRPRPVRPARPFASHPSMVPPPRRPSKFPSLLEKLAVQSGTIRMMLSSPSSPTRISFVERSGRT
jgi:hypothetical protein